MLYLYTIKLKQQEIMTIQELKTKKSELLKNVALLTQTKKNLYSNVDIESPMTANERELNQKIASIYSEINSIVRQIRKAS